MATQSENMATLMSSRYADTLQVLSQQNRDLLSGLVEDVTDQGADAMSDDFVGTAIMRPLNTRDTELQTTPIDAWRRWMYFDDYYHDTTVAKHDEIRLKTMTDARSTFARQQVAAANRQKVATVINASTATMYQGKTGTTPIAFPAGQNIVHGGAGFSTTKFDSGVEMLKTKGMFDEQEGDRIICLWNAKAEKSLMTAVEFASRDYSSMMVREKGRIVSMGLVDFIRVEDLYDPNKQDGSILERYLPYTAGSPNVRKLIMFIKNKSFKRWTPYSANGVVTWEQSYRRYRVSTDISVGARRNHEYMVVTIEVTES